MANLLTRKQIAALIGKKPNYVGIYVDRGHLIQEDEKNKDGEFQIDTDHPINKAYIAKFTGKSLNEQIIKEDEKRSEEESPINDLKGKIKRADVDFIKKKHEIKKLQSDIQLKNLEYKKKKAKVLPLDFVIDWSGRNIRGVFGETVNFGNSIIEQICNELDADTETKLKYKKMFKQGFNEMVKDGIKKQEPEALEHAKEYSLTTKW